MHPQPNRKSERCAPPLHKMLSSSQKRCACMTASILDFDVIAHIWKELFVHLDVATHHNGSWYITNVLSYCAHNTDGQTDGWMDGEYFHSPSSLHNRRQQSTQLNLSNPTWRLVSHGGPTLDWSYSVLLNKYDRTRQVSRSRLGESIRVNLWLNMKDKIKSNVSGISRAGMKRTQHSNIPASWKF